MQKYLHCPFFYGIISLKGGADSMKAEHYKKIIDELIELIDEGIYIVDRDGIGTQYNKAMANMEKVNVSDVLGKKFHEAFPDFSMGESTMFNALKKNVPTIKKQQTYRNLYGKEITTVNSTTPISTRHPNTGLLSGSIPRSRFATKTISMTATRKDMTIFIYFSFEWIDKVLSMFHIPS